MATLKCAFRRVSPVEPLQSHDFDGPALKAIDVLRDVHGNVMVSKERLQPLYPFVHIVEVLGEVHNVWRRFNAGDMDAIEGWMDMETSGGAEARKRILNLDVLWSEPAALVDKKLRKQIGEDKRVLRSMAWTLRMTIAGFPIRLTRDEFEQYQEILLRISQYGRELGEKELDEEIEGDD